MSWSSRRGSRRRAAVLVVVAVALAFAVAVTVAVVRNTSSRGPVAEPTEQAEQPQRPAPAGRTERTVDVMTRNLYLGADLGPVLRALADGDGDAVEDAATDAWAAVRASRPRERMAAIAAEIAAANPAVVGLQEVTSWTAYPYSPRAGAAEDPVVTYDFLALLLDELAARGAAYEPVEGATAQGFASPAIPVRAGPDAGPDAAPDAAEPSLAVRLVDRDVVLRRADVDVAHARVGTFDALAEFSLGGLGLSVPRSWASVDVDTGAARFRFVNAHLEAFAAPGVDPERLRVAQVDELVEAQRRLDAELGELPAVWVGDYNSAAPDAPAYSRLVEAVGRDAWLAAGGRRGATCCFDATLRDPDERLDRRIDLVLVGSGVEAVRAEVVGEEPDDRTPSGRWPSDHAGVVARLVLPVTR